VAAGEVVERPASVIKELVENSIDAGSRRIEVMIRGGGISLMRVVDDGIGMDRDDALLCLERHATSKIRTGADLAAIHTLGFRGEALPSIASVSRFRLSTREREAIAGTEVQVTGGRIDHVRDSGEAPGTQIEVRSLFFNLPARRKFLRTVNTETSHVEHQLQLQAIGHPEIGFVLIADERLVFQLPPVANLFDRVRDLSGAGLAAELLEVPEMEVEGVKIRGLVGKVGVSRSTRAQQLVFVNGRAVENNTINHGLREGYHTALMKGQHPVTFLFIDMDPAAVDVNVHPAKREVRFRDPSSIREAVVEAVRKTLESDRASWSKTFVRPAEPGFGIGQSFAGTAGQQEQQSSGAASTTVQAGFDRGLLGPGTERRGIGGGDDRPAETLPLIPEREQTVLRRDWSSIATALAQTPPPPPSTSSFQAPPANGLTAEPMVGQAGAAVTLSPSPEPVDSTGASVALSSRAEAESGRPSQHFRILGVLGKLYVLMENANGLVLVDQHAAHERILFEELRRRMEQAGVPSQRLLMPVTLQLGPRDSDWVGQNLATLQKMGIGVEEFGVGTWKLDSLPQFVRSSDPLHLLREIIDELKDVSSQTSKLRLGEDVIAKTVCRHAVKANDTLREAELIRLIEDLLKCDLPYCCPHGRPTMIQISYLELEKKFGRKV
jgi:DNA mismatch repair protein MutL